MTDEQYKYYLSKASQICAGKEKCSQDIRNKLMQWGVEKQDGERILMELINSDFINHQRYARAYAKDKLHFNHWGKNKITYALRTKNIEEGLIQEALQQLPQEQYESALRDEMEKKDRALKTKDIGQRKNKLLQYLLQKGFEYGKVFEFVNTKIEEHQKHEQNPN